MKNKIATSDLQWLGSGFTKTHLWGVQILWIMIFVEGIALLTYAFTWRNTFTYETLHILALIAIGIFLAGIAFSLVSIFNLLFYLGADRLGILLKNDDDVV